MAKHNGNYYINAAAKSGCTVKNGKGDHVKIYPPPTYHGNDHLLVVPTNLKGNGTECSIIKILLKWGVVIVLGTVVVTYYLSLF